MDYTTNMLDLESDTVEGNRKLLYFFAFLAFVSSAMHCYAANLVNCVVNVIYAVLVVMFMWSPNIVALTGIMTFSLTLCCASCVLLGTGIFYEKISWATDIANKVEIVAYSADILFTLAIFWVLNAAWETPEKTDVVDDVDDIYDYEHENMWAPFAGNGKVIGSYKSIDTDLEKQDKPAEKVEKTPV